MKKLYINLSIIFLFLFIAGNTRAQNNLAAGDLAIVSYQSDFDPTNPLVGDDNIPQFEDRFSLVVLKPGGIAAGTVIFFTTRGWNGPANTWHDGDFPPNTFGLGRRAVVQWTVPAGGIAKGTEIFFINTYHDEVAVGSEYYSWAAYSNEAGTTLINNLTNVTPIVPAANSTDGMSFAVSGDKLLIYQTGPPAGPDGGPNSSTIRFITALLANSNGTTAVNGTTTYTSWDAVPGAQASSESSIPPGLVNGQTCFLMSPSTMPNVSNGTTEPDNGKFSACSTSLAGACTALQMSAIIYSTNPSGNPTTPNWTYSNSFFPQGSSSSFCTYNMLSPITFTTQPSAVTACLGLPVSFNVVVAGNGTPAYVWQESANAAFSSPTTLSNTGVYSGTGTNTLSISDNTGLSGRYYRVIVTGTCGSATSNGVLLTVTNPGLATANTLTQNVGAQNNLYYASSCGLINKIIPLTGSPINGSVTSQVWIEGTVPTFNSVPFVQRHYQVTPAVNPNGATATITLYFSQAEFTAFNAHPNSTLDLPTSDADVAGKANLRIAKYPGSSTGGTGLPGSYSQQPVLIDPPNSNITYNTPLARWEVTFDVTGFSGFIVQTLATTIPVRLISFAAQKNNNNVLLSWQTSSEINNHHFEVERSTDGRNFINIGQVAAGNSTSVNDYSLTDAGAVLLNVATLYYRLKMISTSGSAEYSRIVSVPLNKKTEIVTGISPNPFKNELNLFLNMPEKGQLDIRISDVAGRILISGKKEMQKGYSTYVMQEVNKLAGGIYFLTVNFKGENVTYKVVK